MDFPLSSSVILVIAVVLWIVWVAPYVLRNGHHQLQPAGEVLADAVDIAAADPQTGKVMMMTPKQEKPMTTTRRSTVSAPSPTPSAGGGRPEQAGPAFRIRYGRLALALAGLLCLLTGVVSAVLRVFAIGSGWLPAVTLLAAVCSVMWLRRLAVRDRRRKVDEAFQSAMSAPSSATAEAPRAPVAPRGRVQRPDSPLFDAEAIAAAPVPAPEPLTAMELRKAALAEAVASGDLAASLDPCTESSVAGDASWEPVEVPKPTYVEAAKAERAAPEPLDLPEAPKAVGKPSLRQGATQAAAAAPANPSGDDDVKVAGKGQRALSNLDDVLQRRRA